MENITMTFRNGKIITEASVSDKHLDDAVRELVRIQTERKTAPKNLSFGKKLRRFITDFSVNNAQEQFKKWVALEQTLLVKFIDGNVKEQDAQGNFIRSKTSDKMPGKISWPGYTDKWKEAVANDHGSVVKVVESETEE